MANAAIEFLCNKLEVERKELTALQGQLENHNNSAHEAKILIENSKITISELEEAIVQLHKKQDRKPKRK